MLRALRQLQQHAGDLESHTRDLEVQFKRSHRAHPNDAGECIDASSQNEARVDCPDPVDDICIIHDDIRKSIGILGAKTRALTVKR